MKFWKEIIAPTKRTTVHNGQKVEHVVDDKRIDHWYSNLTRMRAKGLRIPAPFRHDPKATPVRLQGDVNDVDSYNNGGFWERFEKRDGKLYGLLDVPNADKAKKIKEGEIKDTSLLAPPKWVDGDGEEYQDSITHIALVTHPVEHRSESFEPATVSMSSETQFQAMPDSNPSDDNPTNASSARVKDVIALLAKLENPIVMPADTTADNFLERITVAVNAILGQSQSQEDGSVTEPPGSSTEQPSPVAMSKELQIALGLLSDSKVNNPSTGKPWTEAELKAKAEAEKPPVAEFSAAQQAAINFANKQAQDTYVKRIEACVKTGRVSPAMAKKVAEPMLRSFEVSFNAEGQIVESPLDAIVQAWEQIPQGSVLTGVAPTTARQKQDAGLLGQETAFALGAEVETHEPILKFANGPTDVEGVGEVTPEEAEKIADAQLKATGHSLV